MNTNPADMLAGFVVVAAASFTVGWICHYVAAAIYRDHHHPKGH